MEVASWPSFFHSVYVGDAYVQFAIGIEGMIKEEITSLWSN